MTDNIQFFFGSEKGKLERREQRELLPLQPGQVRVQINASGVCHSDCLASASKMFPEIKYPRVPGHEIAGVITEVHDSVKDQWRVHDRVACGWNGFYCNLCDCCRKGDFLSCEMNMVTGVHFDGGYQKIANLYACSLARIPDHLDFLTAAPLVCAGTTVFTALKAVKKPAGSTVAIFGVGGLGHLGIQFARKMGFYVIAMNRGDDKRDICLELGAHEYINTDAEQDLAMRLKKNFAPLGHVSGMTGRAAPSESLVTGEQAPSGVHAYGREKGCDLILVTSSVAGNAFTLLDGLRSCGAIVELTGGNEKETFMSHQLICKRRWILGWPAGTAKDIEDTFDFALMQDIKAVTEVFPFDDCLSAYDRCMTGEAKFRVVMNMEA
eukprot:CAMPEP_0184693744 /NCGR_PEP_ID=MMETSP0313-20130426/1904_1 /TAXON_ID=2792 /ORGANISM="Porphyridium aerugineum, Strain SAG 1380-2" /LENGTH=379 /DNA_ID=CAMNT_0027151905 /DNA_START=840 /DNA_END=1979 /DNA_ORIENTATION=-